VAVATEGNPDNEFHFSTGERQTAKEEGFRDDYLSHTSFAVCKWDTRLAVDNGVQAVASS